MKRIALLALTLLTPLTARGTTIVMPTDEQLILKSPVIVSGTVLSVNPTERDGMIWTETHVAVTHALKGQTDSTITIRELGGSEGDRITKIFGAPEFTSNERVLLFLEQTSDGSYRVMDLFVGKFGEGKSLDGRRLWLRHDTSQEVVMLDANLRAAEPRNIQRDASGFENFVAERVAGRAGKNDYAVENPVLQSEDGTGRIRSDFTLINGADIYRWFRFDNGQTVVWNHVGSQPGYTGSGVAELQTAMAAWTTYGEAKILYVYGGALGGGNTNGANEVYFNDPLGAISGTWNPATGGTVGLGGYNGTNAGGNFTATFQADPDHPAGTMHANGITQALLTIQDGVSPAKSISSTVLAEIIAHEFGHTLGFGHSTSNSALMYASVTGLGPSLRDDDRAAARWLYPNGNGTGNPTAPAAPSNLSAVVAGSNVDLSWTDNANNETAQSIYVAQGSGTFTNVGSVAANTTAVRLTGLGAGTYRVYVIASNAAGNSAQSNIATFGVLAAPVAAFTMNPTSGNAGVTNFTFFDESSGAVTSRVWQFGDGGTATSSVASHTYAASGQYTVSLAVYGPGGSSATTKTVFVSGPLNPQFAWTPVVPAPGDLVTFTDQSGGGPTSWLWQFGDNASSTLQNPTKKYNTAGTYTVTLTVYRNDSSASTTRTITVANSTGGTQLPVAAFDLPTAMASIGNAVAFTDRSSGAPSAWQWSFGDGGQSTVQHPTHVYGALGAYTVTLTAWNAAGSSQLTKQLEVSSMVPYRGLISAAAQTNGLGGTSWRTELSIYNAGLEGATVTLKFLPTMAQKTVYLAPRQSVTYANTLLDAFGLTAGAGAVTIDAESAASSAQLRVTSRTFTGGAKGTYGQSVPDVQSAQLGRTLFITAMKSSTAFRTNVGLVNRAEAPLNATLTLYGQSGGVIAAKDVTLPASSFQQQALWAMFPEVNGVSHDVLTLMITTNTPDAISGYASVIDNDTQDPIYIQALSENRTNELTIPVVGRTPGANSTFWRSDVTFFNPSASALEVTLRYGGAERKVTMAAHETKVLADVLSAFDLTSGAGTLVVSWNGGSGTVVTSRTYTSTESGGTFGQSIDPIAAAKTSMVVPGLRNDGSFRSNIGFVNTGFETETFSVIILSPAGNELARRTVTLEPGQLVQHSVSSLFSNVNSSSFTMLMEGDANARLFAYGSMVDNASGDPVFFAGQ
ncbi:MAG TPA: PKD domain-containing protein [Thermoanaerobaculia bacterium]